MKLQNVLLTLIFFYRKYPLCLYTDNLSSLQTQERVSNIYPEDLMQIVSHMDSLDNHKVQKGVQWEKEALMNQSKE